MNKINNFQAFSSCKAKYTALEVFGGMYIPKYNSAPGERSGHVRPDSVTLTDTQAPNSYANIWWWLVGNGIRITFIAIIGRSSC